MRASRRDRAPGKPTASGCGSTLTLSAPPRPAANAAIDPRSTFQGAGCATGHHSPGALGLHGRRAGLEAAGLLDARPEDAERSELRELDELLGVGREPEGDHAAGVLGRDARLAQRAQEGDARREREGELLRGRPAGRMDAAGVGDEERTGKTAGPQFSAASTKGLTSTGQSAGKGPRAAAANGSRPNETE